MKMSNIGRKKKCPWPVFQ